MPRIDNVTLDLERSIVFDKEQWLADLVAKTHTTPEEFSRLFVLEEHPVQIEMQDWQDVIGSDLKIVLRTTQEFRIRLKTIEELAEDLSHHITQGEK